jgi:hypothetical protein
MQAFIFRLFFAERSSFPPRFTCLENGPDRPAPRQPSFFRLLTDFVQSFSKSACPISYTLNNEYFLLGSTTKATAQIVY